MKNKHLEQAGHITKKLLVPYNELTEGNDWTMNVDGSWFIPTMDIESEIIDTSQESYNATFAQNQLTLKKCAIPETALPPDQHSLLQSDTGANVNITLDVTFDFCVGASMVLCHVYVVPCAMSNATRVIQSHLYYDILTIDDNSYGII